MARQALLPTNGASIPGAIEIYFDTHVSFGGDPNDNHVQININGVERLLVANPGVDLSSGEWLNAQVVVERAEGGIKVSLILTDAGGSPVTAIDPFFIGGVDLEAYRPAFYGNQTSLIANQDIDNVSLVMTPAAAANPPLVLGDVVNGTIPVAGAVQRYSFTLTEPTSVAVDTLTNNGNLFWQITGPIEAAAARRFTNTNSFETNNENPVLELPAGTYELVVSASGATTGSFSLRVFDLADAAPIALGAAQDLTLTPGNRTEAYSFTGTAGQQLFLDHITGSNDPYWRIIDPQGRMIFNAMRVGDLAPVMLELDGTYTLLVEGRIGTSAPQTLQFAVHDMAVATAAMTLGTTVAGNLPTPGATSRYTFSLSADTYLLFDSLLSNAAFTWSLSGPRGTIDGGDFRNSDANDRTRNTAMFAAAGDYVLTIDGNGDTTGDFAFRLLILPRPPIWPSPPISPRLCPNRPGPTFIPLLELRAKRSISTLCPTTAMACGGCSTVWAIRWRSPISIPISGW